MRGSKARGGGRGPPKGHNFVLTERRETKDEERDRQSEGGFKTNRKKGESQKTDERDPERR